jgi:hypothetical protein
VMRSRSLISKPPSNSSVRPRSLPPLRRCMCTRFHPSKLPRCGSWPLRVAKRPEGFH